jgi:hypothetical protein
MQAITGTRDKTYDLISALYHSLQAAETTTRYIEDADKDGDEEAVTFFRGALENYRQIANQAKELLRQRLSSTSRPKSEKRSVEGDRVDEASEESFPASDAPQHY